VDITTPATFTGPLIIAAGGGAAGWGGSSTGPHLDAFIQGTGSIWVREEFLWENVEATKGSYDWSYYDHYMAEASQRSIRIYAEITSPPSWAPADYSADYAVFVSAFIKRYGSQGAFWKTNSGVATTAITHYTFLNEPYYFEGNLYDPAFYARLVVAATTAGRAADPQCLFYIQAGMQSALENGMWVWWVDAMYDAEPNLNDYFDGVDAHAYGDNVVDLYCMNDPNGYQNYDKLRHIEDLRTLFVNQGAASKPFWLMEAGFSTCTDLTQCVTEAQQVLDFQQLMNYVTGPWSTFVQFVNIYALQDEVTQPTNSVFNNYGIYHLNPADPDDLSLPKPAATYLATFFQRYRGA